MKSERLLTKERIPENKSLKIKYKTDIISNIKPKNKNVFNDVLCKLKLLLNRG